ncbi:hypothetical protein CNR22_07740 [Sphingobacteriaceae bacterium]|nr:hypothetical protein CNR22_07740 [Sphingobacteriaceae bacterium]
MILKNRSFERVPANRDAKVFYIFCEGKRTEPKYFKYFEEIDSRIKFEIIRAEQHENNSPTGLYDKACLFIIKSQANPNPKYEISNIDEVWFVIDTDEWKDKIETLRGKCSSHENWFIAQSNPCFEVWLYYHLKSHAPKFEGIEISSKWKGFVNEQIPGGFNPLKHPILIKDAIDNSKANYIEVEGRIYIGSTEIFKLAEKFYSLIERKMGS